ncbi:MAG: glycoside hydrolase family 11 protein [Oscillospiraceae bacterium]|nr:glycoside hydrolase family 11 protein [Oscillospiraceae bacterium]
MKKRIVLFAVMICAFLMPLTVKAATLEEPIDIKGNLKSSVDGFNFEYWLQNSNEDATMTLTGGGTFESEFNNIFNVLLRTGRRLGSTMPYNELGEITIDYAAEYTIKSGDVFYICVYGWTVDPVVEWYIIETRGNYKPPGRGIEPLGTIEVDGGFYEIYESMRIEQPSIITDKDTFPQYWSIRLGNKTEGTISVSEHFRAWEEAGLDMSGNMYEVSLCVEGFNSSAEAKISKYILTIGDDVYGEDTVLLETDWYERRAIADEPAVIDDEPEEIEEPDEIDEITGSGEPAGNYDAEGVSVTGSFAAVYIAAGVAALVVIAAIIIVFAVKRRK